MKVSGNTTRFAELDEAWWMRDIVFWVVLADEKKIGEAWQIAALRGWRDMFRCVSTS